MLLPLRSLWEAAAAAVEEIVTGTRANRKIQRKLRRLAQWSDAIAPPRRDIVAPVQGIALAPPRLAPIFVSMAAAVSAANPRFILATPSISIAANVAPISVSVEIADVTVEAGIDLFDYEIAALMAA